MLKSKRLWLVFAIIVCLSLSLFACGGGGDADVDTDTGGGSNGTGEVIKIKLAHQSPAENDKMDYACHKLKEYVEEKSGGRVEITIFPAMQLGAEREMLEGIQMGTIEMAGLSTGPFPGVFPEIMVFDMPYLFSSEEVAYEVLDGPVGREILDLMESKIGAKGLAWGENGFRHFTNNVREIRKPEDLKGLKMRTMENPAHMAMMQALGGSPTPMAFNEVYGGLQQGTVDGQENPISLTTSMKFYEVQKFASLDGHIYNPHVLIMNIDFYNNLPEDIQKIFDEAAIIWKDEERKFNKQQTIEGVQMMKDFGVQVAELTDEEILVFREATKSVYDTIGKQVIGEELLNKVLKAVEEAEK